MEAACHHCPADELVDLALSSVHERLRERSRSTRFFVKKRATAYKPTRYAGYGALTPKHKTATLLAAIWSLSRGRVPRPVSGFPACPAVLYVEGTYPCHCPGPGLRRSRRWTAHTPSACDSAEATDGARRVLSAPASAVRVLQERGRSVVSRSHGIASVI